MEAVYRPTSNALLSPVVQPLYANHKQVLPKQCASDSNAYSCSYKAPLVFGIQELLSEHKCLSASEPVQSDVVRDIMEDLGLSRTGQHPYVDVLIPSTGRCFPSGFVAELKAIIQLAWPTVRASHCCLS